MPRYSANHGFYHYFGFKKRHHLLRPALHARVSFILTPLRSQARDNLPSTPLVLRERGTGSNADVPRLLCFRGEKLHTRRAFRKHVSPTTEKVTVYIAHSKSQSVKFVSDIGDGYPRPPGPREPVADSLSPFAGGRSTQLGFAIPSFPVRRFVKITPVFEKENW